MIVLTPKFRMFLKGLTFGVFIAALIIAAQYAYADKRYNAREGRWEITTEDAEIRYNPYTGESRFVPPESDFEYNPYEDEWGAPGESNTSDDYYDDIDYDF